MTRMKTNSLVRSFALLASLALTVPAFAKPFTKTINLAQNAKVGKADLKAGEYRLMIDGSKATVQKGKDVVAESDGRWEDRSNKAAYDSVLLSENGQAKEVRLPGQPREFVFNEEARSLCGFSGRNEREAPLSGRLPACPSSPRTSFRVLANPHTVAVA